MRLLLFIALFCQIARADIAVTNGSMLIFVGDSITDEQEGVHSEPWPHLVAAHYILRNPFCVIHPATHGRGGDVIVGTATGIIYNDANRTNYARYEDIIGWNFTGRSNFVFLSMPYNGSATSNQWALDCSNAAVAYILGSNNATPVLVTGAPSTNANQSSTLVQRNQAAVTLATLSNWPYADPFTILSNRMAGDVSGMLALRWQDHLHPSNRWHIAYAVLSGLGIDTNVSEATLSYASGLASSTNQCTITSNSVAANGSISFSRYDLRLPWPRNVRFDEALPLLPEMERMNWHALKASNISAAHHYILVDGRLVATVTSQQLSNGFNLFTLTNTSYTTQGLNVLNLIRDQHGLNRTNLTALSPQSGVLKFKSNADSTYDWDAPPDGDGRTEGADLIAAVASVVDSVRVLSTNVNSAARPIHRRFSIVATNAPRCVLVRR